MLCMDPITSIATALTGLKTASDWIRRITVSNGFLYGTNIARGNRVKISFFFLVLTPVVAWSAAPASSLQIVPNHNALAAGIVPMSNGSVGVFGSVSKNGCTVTSAGSCDQTETPLLSVLNASGVQTGVLTGSTLGSGNSSISAAAVDSSGNVWITGQTDSDDFPLLRPLVTEKTPYKQTGYVAKLDPNFNILFSTFLGGQPVLGQTVAVSLALDSVGDAYVVGTTNDANFPVSGAVFGTGVPSNNAQNPLVFTFVMKISAGGSNMIFSRLLGANASACHAAGADCSGYNGANTTPYAMAVGRDGSLTIAGSTTAANFPTTAGVYQGGVGSFASRISADGSTLIWSTEVGAAMQLPISGGFALVPGYCNSVAVDASNDVYLAGFTFEPIATTLGALQSQQQLGQTGGNGYIMELSADATRLIFATNLTATIAGLTLDSSGNAWVVGNTIYSTSTGKVNASNFPGLPNIPSTGLDFALELNSNATAAQQVLSFLPPTVTQPPAFDSNGNLVLVASAGNLVRLNTATALTAPAVFAMTNSAIPQAQASIGPGELLTLYGVALGPAAGVSGQPDQNGKYFTQLGGVSVNIKGTLAPLLYVGPNQINLQVPFLGSVGPVTALGTSPISITVTTPTGSLPALFTPVYSSLGIFGVVNEDGSINSMSNPAREGSIIMVYMTGLGSYSTAAPDGTIVPTANSAFVADLEVTSPFFPLGIIYAGNAPTLIDGLDQLNVQLAIGFKNPELVVQTVPGAPSVEGSATSNTVTVYTQ